MSSDDWNNLLSSEENTEEISKLNSKLDKISAIDYLSKFDTRKRSFATKER